jgi:hypothetical protein
VTINPSTNPARRHSIPAVQFTPAASDAMMTANGFTVENIVPMVDPPKIDATGTMAS